MSENWNQLEVQQLENVKMTSHQPPEKILAPIYKLSLYKTPLRRTII